MLDVLQPDAKATALLTLGGAAITPVARRKDTRTRAAWERFLSVEAQPLMHGTTTGVFATCIAALLCAALPSPASGAAAGSPEFWWSVTKATAHVALVARATITQRAANYNESTDEVATEYVAALSEVYKGDATAGSTVAFWVLGGFADGHATVFSHNVFLPEVGSEWILFLVPCQNSWTIGPSSVQGQVVGTDVRPITDPRGLPLNTFVSHLSTVIAAQDPVLQYAQADLVCTGTVSNASVDNMLVRVSAVHKAPSAPAVSPGDDLAVYRDPIINPEHDNTPWRIPDGAEVLCFLDVAANGQWRHDGSLYGMWERRNGLYVVRLKYAWCADYSSLATISPYTLQLLGIE